MGVGRLSTNFWPYILYLRSAWNEVSFDLKGIDLKQILVYIQGNSLKVLSVRLLLVNAHLFDDS